MSLLCLSNKKLLIIRIKMGEVKQINIKNRTYYFYNDIMDLKKFKSNLWKIDKKSYKNINIYNIGYIRIKKIDDCENIYSVSPLYLWINHVSRYIEEKGVNKYLVFDSTDENKVLLKKFSDVFDRIMGKIKEVDYIEYNYENDCNYITGSLIFFIFAFKPITVAGNCGHIYWGDH